mmetsp:Transcript_612/g.1254  ORF Transcript_612/g.1254 Transcript_612/m.1254 type:complete len:318 (-) Transcript_612:326-1279(-)
MKVSIQFLGCLAASLGAPGALAERDAGGAFPIPVATVRQPTTTTTTATTTTTPVAFVHKARSNPEPIAAATAAAVAIGVRRGGACSDSNPALFAKIGVQAVVESAILLGLLVASVAYADLVPVAVFGEPLLILLASLVVVFGSSLVGAIVDGGLSAASNQALNPNQVQGDPNWYANLQKPSWNPPGWLFPIMWLVVSKPTQLCATSRIFKYCLTKNEETGAVTGLPLVPLAVYTTMLALGDAWNKVFFGLECIGWGTVVITAFYGALLTSAYLFYGLDAQAGYYMLPTCAWVTVATALQYSIYLLNKDNCGGGKSKK